MAGIEFGYFLVPDAEDPEEAILETASLADRLGYDLLAVQDHPYQRAHLDSLALLGVILARTERIRVFQDVGASPCARGRLRRPRRHWTCSAAGASRPAWEAARVLVAAHAMGAPALTPGQSLEALEEAVAILRQSWNGADSIRLDGRRYRLAGMKPAPRRLIRSASGWAPQSRARSRSPGAWPTAGPPH